MNKMTPQIRFQGFTDDWEERKVGEFLTESKIKGSDGSTAKKLTVKLWRKGIIPKADIYKGSSGTQYYIRSAGQFMYGKLDFLNQAFGILQQELDGYESTLDSPAFDFEKGIDPKFFLEYVCLEKFYKYQGNIANGSRKAKRIHADTFFDMPIIIPEYKEQQKIGSFFNQLDGTIALHQRKLDLLKEQKKGFLQKMFPKNGSKFPELRFSGFDDDWEERKLGEFSDVRDGTHASPKYVSQGHPMVTSKNLTHSGLDMTDVSFLTDEDFNEINKRSKVSIGDILFGMIGTIGNPVIVDRDDFAIKNVALIKEKTSTPTTNKWLLQYLKSPSFNRFIQKENAGGTQKFIALGLIRDMKLRVPELDEQQKIGSFFKQLDNTIALYQRKLDLLKEQKKGFLQKMFVS
ncbi:restriction endonuclease subunit S [Leuconostoc mesenteroides]|uniref:restriction endonuclease subunit S n=1 Tax=Leuconostoc mesenteroides TaxID=1245 RepID=UPI000D0C2B39|nr:restriction endonuclease subunit S [Leuconostoc mesenteroides]SPE66160.1 EcoKI restriction-modification system protein HsdS [Leuconostoc mesenteroides]